MSGIRKSPSKAAGLTGPTRETKPGGLLSRMRSMIWGPSNTVVDVTPRVPAIVSGRNTSLAGPTLRPADTHSAEALREHNHGGVEPSVGGDLGSRATFGTIRNPVRPSAPDYSMSSVNSLRSGVTPNEVLKDFFLSKGDQELSKMEVVGVLSLIGQAVSRNESVVDFSTMSGAGTVTANNTLADAPQPWDLSSRLSASRYADSSVRSDYSGHLGSSGLPRRVRSTRRRKYLAAGPKVSPLRAAMPSSVSMPRIAGSSGLDDDEEPSTLSGARARRNFAGDALRRPLSNTASALSAILDETDAPGAGRQLRSQTPGNVAALAEPVQPTAPTLPGGPSWPAPQTQTTAAPTKESLAAPVGGYTQQAPRTPTPEPAPAPAPASAASPYSRYKPSEPSSLRHSTVGHASFKRSLFAERHASTDTQADSMDVDAFGPAPMGLAPTLSADVQARLDALKSQAEYSF